MRQIYLPNLKKIRIQNFSLYPNGLDFQYDFINGVNLIIGGNGMGKTTFVNIIKYAVIGHYKKRYGFTRTYKDRKIEKRISYPPEYYKNREDKAINLEAKSTVTIEFKIDKDYFVVERFLGDLYLKSVLVNDKKLHGDLIRQDKYDQLKDNKKIAYLYHKYEQKVSAASNIAFDDLIFFVNEILFFGEEHKTILWDEDNSNVQGELFSKYFNEPNLDRKRQEADREAQYYDSLARHRSEDMRAINKVLKQIEEKNSEIVEEKSLERQLLELRKQVENLENQIDLKQDERRRVEDQISRLNNRLNVLSKEENELDENKKILEHKILGSKWRKLHKNYDAYFQSIKLNEICPMCNQDLHDDFVQKRVLFPDNCYLCSQKIEQMDSGKFTKQYEDLHNQLSERYSMVIHTQQELEQKEKFINGLDLEFRELASHKRELQIELRLLEYNSQKSETPTNELQAFYDEIEDLQKQKKILQEKSRKERKKFDDISEKIESHIAENTLKFSALFSEFAGRFLGVKCELTYTDAGTKSKRFYPVIEGTTRYTEEELSESQRFFVDHAFRMSILSFFYTKPAFYIVETPNSSLDISYERNAADVFIKFLEKPNTLILTTNLNNSEFLTHLTDATHQIKVINLLDIGKKSNIQRANKSINSISNEIISKIGYER